MRTLASTVFLGVGRDGGPVLVGTSNQALRAADVHQRDRRQLLLQVRGVAGGTGAAHANCAKICILQKDAAVGILTHGDGLFKIWGSAAKDKYANLFRSLADCRSGTEVTLLNKYDVRSFDLQTIERKATDAVAPQLAPHLL